MSFHLLFLSLSYLFYLSFLPDTSSSHSPARIHDDRTAEPRLHDSYDENRDGQAFLEAPEVVVSERRRRRNFHRERDTALVETWKNGLVH
jgi:hypothetical protein